VLDGSVLAKPDFKTILSITLLKKKKKREEQKISGGRNGRIIETVE